jgi:1,4-dihydroxy-2-naphthoyl-CoA hydrolase
MSAHPFVHRVTIGLGRSDAAGVIYFTEALDLAHEAAEAFLDSAGIPLRTLLEPGQVKLPVVHAEADYMRPVRPGDRLELRLASLRVGHSSITFEWVAAHDDGQEAFRTRIVHACIDAERGVGVAVPDAMRTSLTPRE